MRGTPFERFMGRVNVTPTCWLWFGETEEKGYGRFNLKPSRPRVRVAAHRWIYEYLVGPIPEGLTIDHLCNVPACQNPAHMEPVTRSENARRGHARRKARRLAEQQPRAA
jgi:hypothetical protein